MNETPPPGQDRAAEIVEKLAQVNQKLAEAFLDAFSANRPAQFVGALQPLAPDAAPEPDRWADLNADYYGKQISLFMSLLGRQPGEDRPPALVEPEKGDRRFSAKEWSEQPLFDYLKQSYLLTSNWLTGIVESTRLEAASKRKLAFFARQYIDAMAPSNFPTTNPEALKLAADTQGESISRGLENLLGDLDKGRITMVDESAFEVGRNLAVTPGSVVYENDILQLLEYAPQTPAVHEVPFLIIPPFINKYYILDLQPENSFVRFCSENGLRTFLVSWRNVPEDMGGKTWDDYIEQAVFQSMRVVQEIAGAPKVNMLGFCVGGTLLASALAVLAARGDDRVNSLTLLTTMLDFTEVGEISAYLDEARIEQREKEFLDGGVLSGRDLAQTFASLRANDLIWNYVVNNYLKGRTPEAFDLLYWNSDGSNLPGRLYAYYLRNMYWENNLRVPGKLTMCGVPVDLGAIRVPAYVLAAREDHIVPWKSAYVSARLLGGEVEFVLSASGHIAGAINPASKNRRNYWAGGVWCDEPDRWFESARQVPGSWWNHWIGWMKSRSGSEIPAPEAQGSGQYPPLEPAPGRYVRVRLG